MAETVDINAPVAQAQQNRRDLTGLFGDQRTADSGFLGRYTDAINGQESTSAIANRIGNELNLPTLRNNANMLNRTMRELPSTYSKATTGFDVNANQLSRVIGQKSGELAPALATANEAVTSATGDLNTRLGYEKADQEKLLRPYDKEQSLLSERNARETTGYTTAMQSELDAIIAKMNAGITISENEKNRAHALALAEQQFKNQMALQKDQQAFTSGENRQNRLLQLAGQF